MSGHERLVARCERQVGRYQIYGELGAGGMATVHFGWLVGDAGFARAVAIKRLHPHYAKLPEFSTMFLDEARVAARIRHSNVVATVDTVAENDELLLVMEFVLGESLWGLARAAAQCGERVPVPIAVRICADALYGLHAAHGATDERGEPLSIVHRDVSPQNILVGVDGLARVLDFGIAKASSRIYTTRDGQRKGKLHYMAPEQIADNDVSARTDVYALSVVLWELLTARRLFEGSNEGAVLAKVLEGVVVPPHRIAPHVPEALSDVIVRGLTRDPNGRYESAHAMAVALESASPPALGREVAEWVDRVAHESLARRRAYIAAMEEAVQSGVGVGTREVSGSAAAAAVEAVSVDHVRTRTDVPHEADAATLVDPPRATPARTPARVRIGVAGGLASLVFAVLAISVAYKHREEPPALPAGAAPSPLAPSAVATTPPSPEPETTAPRMSAEIPREAPQAEAPPSPKTKSAPKRVAAPSRSRPHASATKPGCDPPWVEDATGIRRVKSECL